LDELYNDNYGYKSGVNNSMKNHLKSITISASKYVELNKKNIVLDIASNDGTLLKNYNKKLVRVGIDPVIKKYKSSYRNMRFIDNFFSLENYKKKFNEQKVKIITSIAVFYDVPYPAKFVSDISKIMHKDGIWVLEQSYFPHLVKNNAYDSICHEHLTYFTIKQINLLLKKSGLQIFNITSNNMNGGSIRFFIKFENNNKINKVRKNINFFYSAEKKFYNNFWKRLSKFKLKIKKNKTYLLKFIKKTISLNKSIHIYGASTKGNIILQYCKIDQNLIKFAADRNPDKFNRFTPGSNIKIISEKKSRALKPDYYLVMPWHFEKEIIKREKLFSLHGGKLLFPLPEFKII
jgi:hypothetical protein